MSNDSVDSAGSALAKNCRSCEYYIPYSKTDGWCDRIEDPSAVFPVSALRTDCIYTSPGKTLSPEETSKREERTLQESREFRTNLERLAEEVRAWPDWKKGSYAELLKPKPNSTE